tara:strand:- start:416 stop:1009 length:594 start_codon:yes stop_codon:yes gene_type:complete
MRGGHSQSATDFKARKKRFFASIMRMSVKQLGEARGTGQLQGEQAMADKEPNTQYNWIAAAFEWVERSIYVVLGLLLGLIAALSPTDFTPQIVTLLGRLLLVLLIVELLYTVRVSYSAGTIVLEPFLLVGLIAAIRRIFVLTAQFAEAESAHTMPFDQFVIELGALSGLILVLVVALWLLRRSEATPVSNDGHLEQS